MEQHAKARTRVSGDAGGGADLPPPPRFVRRHEANGTPHPLLMVHCSFSVGEVTPLPFEFRTTLNELILELFVLALQRADESEFDAHLALENEEQALDPEQPWAAYADDAAVIGADGIPLVRVVLRRHEARPQFRPAKALERPPSLRGSAATTPVPSTVILQYKKDGNLAKLDGKHDSFEKPETERIEVTLQALLDPRGSSVTGNGIRAYPARKGENDSLFFEPNLCWGDYVELSETETSTGSRGKLSQTQPIQFKTRKMKPGDKPMPPRRRRDLVVVIQDGTRGRGGCTVRGVDRSTTKIVHLRNTVQNPPAGDTEQLFPVGCADNAYLAPNRTLDFYFPSSESRVFLWLKEASETAGILQHAVSQSERTETRILRRIPAVQHQVRIMIIGTTGTGKTSLVNALMGRRVYLISDQNTGTYRVQEYVTQIGNMQLILIDTPGAQDANLSFEDEVEPMIVEYLEKHGRIDAVWYLIEDKTVYAKKPRTNDIESLVAYEKLFIRHGQRHAMESMVFVFTKCGGSLHKPEGVLHNAALQYSRLLWKFFHTHLKMEAIMDCLIRLDALPPVEATVGEEKRQLKAPFAKQQDRAEYKKHFNLERLKRCLDDLPLPAEQKVVAEVAEYAERHICRAESYGYAMFGCTRDDDGMVCLPSQGGGTGLAWRKELVEATKAAMMSASGDASRIGTTAGLLLDRLKSRDDLRHHTTALVLPDNERFSTAKAKGVPDGAMQDDVSVDVVEVLHPPSLEHHGRVMRAILIGSDRAFPQSLRQRQGDQCDKGAFLAEIGNHPEAIAEELKAKVSHVNLATTEHACGNVWWWNMGEEARQDVANTALKCTGCEWEGLTKDAHCECPATVRKLETDVKMVPISEYARDKDVVVCMYDIRKPETVEFIKTWAIPTADAAPADALRILVPYPSVHDKAMKGEEKTAKQKWDKQCRSMADDPAFGGKVMNIKFTKSAPNSKMAVLSALTSHMKARFDQAEHSAVQVLGLAEMKQDPSAAVELNLTDMELVRAPTELSECCNLQRLRLGKNYLRNLSVGTLSALTHIWLHGNELSSFPDGLTSLPALRCVVLHRNQIEGIPSDIWRLSELEELSLEHNRIVVVPDSICELARLRVLNLNHNMVEELPAAFGRLVSLKFLSLVGNRLQCMPPSFTEEVSKKKGKEMKLSFFDVRGNPGVKHRLNALKPKDCFK